jgi:REP element-mobilizing transposase RayT
LATRSTFDDGFWFHVTNRGVARQEIFRREPDYVAFLDSLGRHLGGDTKCDVRGRPYEQLGELVTVSSYCLMPNHFHLLALNRSPDGSALSSLMRRSQTAYVQQFNKRHGRDGPLYRGSFHTESVESVDQLREVVTYIHLNFENNPLFRHSSHGRWLGGGDPSWIQPEPALRAIGGIDAYLQAMVAKLKKRSRARLSEANLKLADAEQRVARAKALGFSARSIDVADAHVISARKRAAAALEYRDLLAGASTLDEILRLRGLL